MRHFWTDGYPRSADMTRFTQICGVQVILAFAGRANAVMTTETGANCLCMIYRTGNNRHPGIDYVASLTIIARINVRT